jgi:hypothetical protein
VTARAQLLAETSRYTEAVAAIGEAIGLYHELVWARGDTALPGLASALVTQAQLLADLAWQPSGGLAAIDEAISVYEQLERSYPGSFATQLQRAQGLRRSMLPSDAD